MSNPVVHEPVAICYTFCGPTYEKSAISRLNNDYFDDPDVYYYVICDRPEVVRDKVKRKNLVVNHLKDFYEEFPWVEKNEWFLESESADDYARKFNEQRFRYPFSVYRFHLWQLRGTDIRNVCFLNTDTKLNISRMTPEIIGPKSRIHVTVSWWDLEIETNPRSKIAQEALISTLGIRADRVVRILDGAGRLMVFEDVDQRNEFFENYNVLIKDLYERRLMHMIFSGSYAVNDEYIVSLLLNAMKIMPTDNPTAGLMIANHNPSEERFWV